MAFPPPLVFVSEDPWLLFNRDLFFSPLFHVLDFESRLVILKRGFAFLRCDGGPPDFSRLDFLF